MTNQKLYQALEICLQALEHGADVESCLALFPAMADDLRPILTAALQARSGAVADVPAEAARRGKARVLQAAAEMREQTAVAPAALALRHWQKGLIGTRLFRLAVTTAAMLAFLLTGGTGLVSASSSALPGDHLYPVKRSWEGVRLFFVVNPSARLQLEQEFEHERFQEIEELYSVKRVAQVNFQGELQTRGSGDWVIGGLDVSVNGNLTPDPEMVPGVTVQVVGEADNGVIKAEQIILVATPISVPTTTPSVTPTLAPSSTLAPSETQPRGQSEIDGTPQPTGTSELPAFNPTGTRRPPSGGSDNNNGSSSSSSNTNESESHEG